MVNLARIVLSLSLSRLLCLRASLTPLCSSALDVIMGHCFSFVIPLSRRSLDNALQSQSHKSAGYAHIQEPRMKRKGILILTSGLLAEQLLSGAKVSFSLLISWSLCSGLEALPGKFSKHYRWDRAHNNADVETSNKQTSELDSRRWWAHGGNMVLITK